MIWDDKILPWGQRQAGRERKERKKKGRKEITMSGAFVKDDEEQTARREALLLAEKRSAFLELLIKKRERVRTDPKLAGLPFARKQQILARIAHEIKEVQEQLSERLP
jgi:hypothetical protein